MKGQVAAICICRVASQPMESVDEVLAIAGRGLEGDRYATGEGSYNKGKPGNRQVTLINGLFFEGSGFTFADSRRNIVTMGIELNECIGQEFRVGDALFKGVKYCDPCQRPNTLAGIERSFKEAFFDRGGLIAEILEGGIIRVGDEVIPPPKSYGKKSNG